jgi:hypothetical protein
VLSEAEADLQRAHAAFARAAAASGQVLEVLEVQHEKLFRHKAGYWILHQLLDASIPLSHRLSQECFLRSLVRDYQRC